MLIILRKLVLIFWLTCSVLLGFSQEDTLTETRAKNSIYLELGGNGFIYSINYERVVLNLKPNIDILLRGGFEYIPRNFIFPEPNEPVVVVPFEVGILKGNNGNFFELGGGISFGKSFYNNGLWKDWGMIGVARIGYRRVKENGSIFRIGFVPLFEGQDGTYPWLGISFGKSF